MEKVIQQLKLLRNHRIGCRIQQLVEFLHEKGQHAINPTDVSLFLNDFAEHILKLCNLSENKERSTLRLYLYRTIYPRIISFCRLYETGEERSLDLDWSQKIRWIRTLPYEDLDVSIKLFGNEEIAKRCFMETSLMLTDCNLHCVPTDMLNCIFLAAKNIAKHFKATGAMEGMSADEFFPIFIYCVAFAEIPRIHQCVGFLRRFSAPNEQLSEMGYCLTSLEAAMSHLSSFTPETVETKRFIRASGRVSDPPARNRK